MGFPRCVGYRGKGDGQAGALAKAKNRGVRAVGVRCLSLRGVPIRVPGQLRDLE